MAGNVDETRHFERYLAVDREWSTPEEKRKFLRALGPPDEATKLVKDVERLLADLSPEVRAEIKIMVQDRKDREAVWRFIKIALATFVAGTGVLGTALGIMASLGMLDP